MWGRMRRRTPSSCLWFCQTRTTRGSHSTELSSGARRWVMCASLLLWAVTHITDWPLRKSDYTVLFCCLKGQYVKTKCLKTLNAQWHGIKCHLPMNNKVLVIKPCVVTSSITGLLSCYATSHFALDLYDLWNVHLFQGTLKISLPYSPTKTLSVKSILR